MLIFVQTMQILIFVTTLIQGLNITTDYSSNLSSNESLVSTEIIGISLDSNISSIDYNVNDYYPDQSNNNNNSVHQSVLMIPLMLPHMRLMLEFCLCISSLCLTMHLIVYGFVPKLRNTPGKCLMSLSLSLLSAAITFVLSLHIQPSPISPLCMTVAIIRFYSFLASFFWMNVLAYDVYKTFTRALKFKISIIKLKGDENHKFLYYSLYGWLMPALIVIITLVLQNYIAFDSPYNPSYGQVTCGISRFAPILIFFFIPVSIILTINVILFIITARKLKQTARETRFATKSKAKVSDRLVLYMKLLTIMGFTWIFWFIALFTQTPVFTYSIIILHGLNGAFIFVAFTVKRSVYRLVVSRIKYLRGHRHINTTIRRLNTQIKNPNNVLNRSLYSKSETQFSLWNDPFRDRYSSV